MGLYFPLPFLLPIFKGGENKMKRKWLKKSVIALMLATVLMSTVGCGVDDIGGSGNSGKLDIDYVGEDGEVTEEEVTPESTGVMAWLKGKLSADKKQSGRHATEVASANNNTEEESGLRGLYGLTESANTEKKKETEAEQKQTVPEQETDGNDQKAPSREEEKKNEAPIPDSGTDKNEDNKKNPTTVKKNTVTFTIRCDTAVNNGMDKEAKWAGIVPSSGCILPVTTMEFEEGETVFDLLCTIRDTYKLQMEYTGTNGGQYIQGINNLYEFDGGRWSGWMYCVNGWYPNYGCGQYVVKSGDVIEWNYTCDLGLDLDADMPGAQEWKDTHD